MKRQTRIGPLHFQVGWGGDQTWL